eukprot:TRINITY_DN8569_c0_g1_i1.p1 TRINITY_DN8569_c0_g1~~TRINITY_DN8569_c0_g1_i1.p1  ORF type:complete len:137 (+),score=14.99 TRINITY_DN8569_c0_g1_i1:78-488(+)
MSDSDDETLFHQRRKVPEHDWLYDKKADRKDQNWVTRRKYKVGNEVFDSDAVLDCPCCFETLCYISQRHQIYKTQYRAVFVTDNCVVDANAIRKHLDTKGQNEQNYSAVKCSSCNTEVGVFDSEEVYHFFNVVPSH